MLNGNTETFDSSILPGMLRSIDTFTNIFPHAEFQVEHDISALISAPRIPKPRPPHSAVPSDEYEALLNELRVWCEPRGRKLELARRLDVSPTLVTFWLRGERLLSLEQWLAIKKIIRPVGSNLVYRSATGAAITRGESNMPSGNFDSKAPGVPAVIARAFAHGPASNGVYGITSSEVDSAVYGEHAKTGIGVFARGGPNGGEGVFGQTASGSSGVYGKNTNTSHVKNYIPTSNNPGVIGESASGTGVVGISSLAAGDGVVGSNDQVGGYGCPRPSEWGDRYGCLWRSGWGERLRRGGRQR
jgi:hypothetical protein